MGKHKMVVNVPNDSLISILKFDLEKIKKDFKAMDEKNAFLIRVLEYVDKILFARNTLNHLTSLKGNNC